MRFLEVVDYYNDTSVKKCFSDYINLHKKYEYKNLLLIKKSAFVKYIGYCIMQDHYHILIKIEQDNLLSTYVSKFENSFSRYFNLKYNRKGPLWQSRFRAVRITSNEQLLHVTRYIHINPTTANYVNKPEEWKFSSYNSYIGSPSYLKHLPEISIRSPKKYKMFVENNIDYQRTLRKIKKILLE